MRNLFLASATAATLLSGLAGPAMAQQRGGGQQGGQGQPTGSFSQSCRNTQVQGGLLSAECLDTQGRYRQSSIPYGGCRGGVSNNNGVLYCDGATASAGAYVGGPNNNNNNNRADNRNDNRGAGGNAEVYAPGYRYPTFGDQHYGDARYDPRYGPQGWGAGHRPGEWVWIRDRAEWLNRQIDRDLSDGALRRNEASDLRRQMDALVDRENTYRRQGLSNSMRADLDRRFDQIAFRVQDAERNLGGRRDNGDRRDNNGYGR